ncbi:MAG: hypothetical protein ACTSW1_01230 [Candidatus Hodarchaeales archaeon]
MARWLVSQLYTSSRLILPSVAAVVVIPPDPVVVLENHMSVVPVVHIIMAIIRLLLTSFFHSLNYSFLRVFSPRLTDSWCVAHPV